MHAAPTAQWRVENRFFKRLVANFGEPRVVVTDKLRSYIKQIKTLAPDADHRAHDGLNSAIEVSHRLTRKREKIMGRFKSHRQAQRFLSAHDQINLMFRPSRCQLTANSYRHARSDALNLWDDYAAEVAAKSCIYQYLTSSRQQLGNTLVTSTSSTSPS